MEVFRVRCAITSRGRLTFKACLAFKARLGAKAVKLFTIAVPYIYVNRDRVVAGKGAGKKAGFLGLYTHRIPADPFNTSLF